MPKSQSRIQEVWPLSPLQEGLLFHGLYDAHSLDVYIEQHFFDLAGPVDPARLRAAGQALLDRHANLRAGFTQTSSGQPVQVVSRRVVLPWLEADLSGLVEPEAQAEAAALARQEREQRFDLAAPPLLRFVLARLGANRWRLVITSHHLLFDGWSMPLLLQELLALYRAGADAALPRVTPYRSFLAWWRAKTPTRRPPRVARGAGRAPSRRCSAAGRDRTHHPVGGPPQHRTRPRA